MNLFLYYFVFAGGDEEICDGWHAFQCKSSRVSSSSKGIIDKRSSANQEKKAPFKPGTYYLFASRDNIRDFFLRKGKEERRGSTQGETLLAVSEKLV